MGLGDEIYDRLQEPLRYPACLQVTDHLLKARNLIQEAINEISKAQNIHTDKAFNKVMDALHKEGVNVINRRIPEMWAQTVKNENHQ